MQLRPSIAGRLNRPLQLLLGLVTLWPPFYLILFVGFFLYRIARNFAAGAPAASAIPPAILLTFVALQLATTCLSLALLVFYEADIFTSERLGGNQKVLWAVVLFLGNLIAMPLYWYMCVWRHPRQ